MIGAGVSFERAERELQDETLESVAIIETVGRALPKLIARGLTQPGDFPLMEHLYRIVCCGEEVHLPWEDFFR
jgi:hypothetical protein